MVQFSDAVERNLAALQRIVAALTAMIAGRTSLPRRAHRAAISLLLPAEAAARRLIIAASAGMTVSLPVFRRRWPEAGRKRAASTALSAVLALIDPLRRPESRRRTCPPHAAPRITCFGSGRPADLPPPPRPGDPIGTDRLARRLAALESALNDLPGQARRFARWRALREAARKRRAEALSGPVSPGPVAPPHRHFRSRSNRLHLAATHKPPPPPPPRRYRFFPLRGGRPPGGRLGAYDPDAAPRAGVREIDEILAHAHSLAMHVLDQWRPRPIPQEPEGETA